MPDTNDKESSQIIFRIYPEPSGKVLLLYEPLEQQVEIASPINKENLEKAKELLVTNCQGILKTQEEQLEVKDEGPDTPQQAAHRSIKTLLEPPPPPFWTNVWLKFESGYQGILALAATVFMIGAVYKGVEWSQVNLPEYLHWIVLAVYLVCLTLCVYLM